MPNGAAVMCEVHLQFFNVTGVAARVASAALAADCTVPAGVILVEVAEGVVDIVAAWFGFEDLPESIDLAADGFGLDFDVEVEVGPGNAYEGHQWEEKICGELHCSK